MFPKLPTLLRALFTSLASISFLYFHLLTWKYCFFFRSLFQFFHHIILLVLASLILFNPIFLPISIVLLLVKIKFSCRERICQTLMLSVCYQIYIMLISPPRITFFSPGWVCLKPILESCPPLGNFKISFFCQSLIHYAFQSSPGQS